MKRYIRKWFLLTLGMAICSGFIPNATLAFERTMSFTDREIVERLTRLEEGQKGLEKRIERLEEGQKALAEGQKNLAEGQKNLAEGQKNLAEGQKALERRVDRLEDRMLGGFAVIFTGIIAMIGFVLWDRRTTLAPVVRDMEALKTRERNLEEVLRKYATKDPELREAMKSLGLL